MYFVNTFCAWGLERERQTHANVYKCHWDKDIKDNSFIVNKQTLLYGVFTSDGGNATEDEEMSTARN